jgi:hypothetical protein
MVGAGYLTIQKKKSYLAEKMNKWLNVIINE